MSFLSLYLVKRPEDIPGGYDTYDSFVVCCETIEGARNTHPGSSPAKVGRGWEEGSYQEETWVYWSQKDRVVVKKIGQSSDDMKVGVVCHSFNAG